MTRVGSCAVFVTYDPVRTASSRCAVRRQCAGLSELPRPGTGSSKRVTLFLTQVLRCLGQSHPKKHFKQNKIRSGVCHVCPGPSSSLPCPLRPQPCTMNVFRVFDGFSSQSGLQLRPSQEDVHDLSHRHSMLSLLFPSEKRCALLGCHERATHSL